MGGLEGLKQFENYPNFLGTWSLEGQQVIYGGEPVEDTQREFPAIIDTGTSQIQVPQTVFAHIREQWEKDFPRKITCSDEEAFCTTEESCETAAKSVKPIGL